MKLLTVTNRPEHATKLVQTATKHGWDITVIEREWLGFGTKLIGVYEYLKQHPEVDRFVFADAFDVVVFGSPEEFEGKFPVGIDMLVSAEKGLWPPTLHPFIGRYSTYKHGFNYPNSGLYYAESWMFKLIFETYPPFKEIDDQYWLNICSLFEKRIECDFEQKLFNSHSFIAEGEYTYENGRVQIMGNEPVFVHSNGKTKDEKLDELVTKMLAS